MDDSAFRRFGQFGALSEGELSAIRALVADPQTFPRHTILRREGDAVPSFFMLLEGWAATAITLPDGARQILTVHFPGDGLGAPSMALDQSAASLIAITRVTVAEVTLERFGQLLDQHPRVGAYILLGAQRERIALMDRLTSIGRTTAELRIASFLLDTVERLEPLGLVENNAFSMLLTQEQIGDTLGMTTVHVNRTFRALDKAGLIRRRGTRWQLLDVPGLTRVAKRPSRALRSDLSWLPPAR